MSRDDDEAPDPRHSRTGSGGLAVVLLVVVLLVVVAVVGGGFVLVRKARQAERAMAEEVEIARMEADQARAAAERRPGPLAGGPATDFRSEIGERVTIDGLTVKVVSAEVGKARILRDAKRNLFVEDDEQSLLVRIELSATGMSRKYSYATWRSAKSPAATDDLANTYDARPITVGGSPGWVRTAVIGDTVIDTLAFESPVVEAGHVEIDLPGENVGVVGTFRFRIPRSAWEKK